MMGEKSRMKRGSGTSKLILGGAALVLTIAAIVVAVTFYERAQRQQEESALQSLASQVTDGHWTGDNTVVFDGDTYGFDHRLETFLFIGTDASGNESGEGDQYRGAMADFLLLAVLDHTENTIGYLQIDRNTVTEVEQRDIEGNLEYIRELQICTAHWYGHSPEMSAENTVTAVKLLLGELDHIDGYYVVNMEDIGQINSAVGGVTITIEEDLTMVDPAFEKGKTVKLTDEQAERFVRARMGVGNEENASRMTRQQQYMDGLFKNVKVFAKDNPKYGNELWKKLRNIAVTDMNGNAFSRMANKMIQGEDKGIFRLTGETRLGTILQDGLKHEEFYPETDSIRDAMTKLFSLVLVETEEYAADVEDDEEDLEEDEDDDILAEDDEDGEYDEEDEEDLEEDEDDDILAEDDEDGEYDEEDEIDEDDETFYDVETDEDGDK